MSPKKSRPKTLSGETWEINSPCGEIYVTVNFDNDRLQEVFFRFKKKSQGSCQSTIANGFAMITSYALRSGAEAYDIIKGMKGHCCSRSWAYQDGKPITSCIDAIGTAIENACVARYGEDFADLCVTRDLSHDPEGEYQQADSDDDLFELKGVVNG